MTHLRLVVMRHAKTEPLRAKGTDHERALTERGRNDTPRIAGRLDELGWVPDEVFCSDAMRTTQTLDLMSNAWRWPGEAHLSRRLYLAPVQGISEVLRRGEGQTLMVVGHNPGLEGLVQLLCGQSIRMTTGNAVLLRRELVPWSRALDPDGWGLVDVLRPKTL